MVCAGLGEKKRAPPVGKKGFTPERSKWDSGKCWGGGIRGFRLSGQRNAGRGYKD